MPVRRFRDYDPFAWLYTRYWGDEFHKSLLPALDRAVLGALPRGASVLDLCCGDGRLSAHLVRRGFAVTGIDGSQEMLEYAGQSCPRAKFILADARDFHLPKRVDAALSTFDSLNHVMAARDLSCVFANVWNCLKRGGLFVFDLNGEQAYKELWVRGMSTVEDDAVSVARGSYDQRKRIATCDVTLLRLAEGEWSRDDFVLRQKYHPRPMVLRLLKKAGFAAEVHEAPSLGMKGYYGLGRDIYVARK
jgi:SAM-dependent methyltransferase